MPGNEPGSRARIYPSGAEAPELRVRCCVSLLACLELALVLHSPDSITRAPGVLCLTPPTSPSMGACLPVPCALYIPSPSPSGTQSSLEKRERARASLELLLHRPNEQLTPASRARPPAPLSWPVTHCPVQALESQCLFPEAEVARSSLT